MTTATQTDTAPKFIWTKSAVAKWHRGQSDPMHTISAPNIADVYMGFVSQSPKGTPWLLVRGSEIVASGLAGHGITEIYV